MTARHRAFIIGFLAGALIMWVGQARGHGDAQWIADDPDTRYCCGVADCGPVRVYGGTVEEIESGVWVVTIPPGGHPMLPRGAQRTFREGDSNVHWSQRLEAYVCGWGGELRCFFPEPRGF